MFNGNYGSYGNCLRNEYCDYWYNIASDSNATNAYDLCIAEKTCYYKNYGFIKQNDSFYEYNYCMRFAVCAYYYEDLAYSLCITQKECYYK